METFYKTEKFARLQFRRENHLHATAKRWHGDQNIWVWRKTWMIGFESTCWWVGFEKYFAGIFFSEKRKFSFVFCFIIRVYNYFDMYCQRNFMLYVINYVIFLEIKIGTSPFFFTIDFLPSSIYISYNVNWQFCKWSVFTTCIGINTDIYVLYKLRFTLECIKYNCPSSW